MEKNCFPRDRPSLHCGTVLMNKKVWKEVRKTELYKAQFSKRASYCPRRRGFNNVERISCLCVRSFTDSTLEFVRPELNLLVLVFSDPNFVCDGVSTNTQ